MSRKAPPNPRRKAPETVRNVLERVVRKLDVEDRLASHSVGPVWERAVSPRLAAHTRPVSLSGGVLTVEARSAAWMNEASLLREQIRLAVNGEIGRNKVRTLRFRLGGGFPPPPGAETMSAPELAEGELESAQAELGTSEGARIASRARALQRRRTPSSAN